MEDIQILFKETIAEFMENGLDAELDGELGYSKYDYKNKDTDNSRNGYSSKILRTSFGDVDRKVNLHWTTSILHPYRGLHKIWEGLAEVFITLS